MYFIRTRLRGNLGSVLTCISWDVIVFLISLLPTHVKEIKKRISNTPNAPKVRAS